MEETKKFEDLNLNPDLVKGIYLYGFKNPSKIQIKGIESINTGRDCLLQSQSGTGKTATYLLGVLNRIEISNKLQALIILPTRELAEQVYQVALKIAKQTKIKMELCMGGHRINYSNLFKSNLIIGTTGRIFHLLDDKKINFHSLKLCVLDESDDLLADGLQKKLKNIVTQVPESVQHIFISATINLNVFNTSKKVMYDPIKVLLKKSEVAVDLISQFYYDVETEDNKFDVLLDIYNLISTSQAIIFCNTIRKVKWLEQKLIENNFTITTIHGDMTQDERKEIINDFRESKTRLLLTTDLLARGIDIPSVNLVINYDLPPNRETYMHRIGRCGRFDKKGVSISFVKMNDPIDVKVFNKMKNFYSLTIKELPIDIEKYL
tara:strand:- start:6180 stop:7313 length:1134 start_codon:yes stop_codon:yes gene_type:complete